MKWIHHGVPSAFAAHYECWVGPDRVRIELFGIKKNDVMLWSVTHVGEFSANIRLTPDLDPESAQQEAVEAAFERVFRMSRSLKEGL